MAKKPVRNRSQTLSLRTSPAIRYTLEKSSNYFRLSMTDVIERGVSMLMQATEFEIPRWVKPVDSEKTITLKRVIHLTWSDEEIIRVLRTAIIAPVLLSSDEALAVMVIFNKIPGPLGRNSQIDFRGCDDPFDGIEMSDDYYKEWPRLNIKLCSEHLELLKEYYHKSESEMDLGFAFRGMLGDIRGIEAVPGMVGIAKHPWTLP